MKQETIYDTERLMSIKIDLNNKNVAKSLELIKNLVTFFKKYILVVFMSYEGALFESTRCSHSLKHSFHASISGLNFQFQNFLYNNPNI